MYNVHVHVCVYCTVYSPLLGFRTLWPAVVPHTSHITEVTLGYVNITWDTNGEEVTLEFIHKEKAINIEKVTKDYYKPNISTTWLKDIPKNDTITLKVKSCLEM